MSKQRLIERLEWYYPMERFHAYVTFPGISVLILIFNQPKDVLFLLYGMFVCIYILYQGQRYWKLKLFKLTDKPFNQETNLRFFKTSKKNNIILIGIMPIVLFLQYYSSNFIFQPRNLVLFGCLANLFAIAEYINYYHFQLSIDNQYDWDYLLRNKRFKKSKLAKNLENKEI